jgi:hypothetical protein
MKRILLSFATLIATTLIGYAQHTQNTTGFSNDCDEIGVLATDNYQFSNWPLDGGYDNAKEDTIKFGYYVAASSSMYMIFELNTPVDLSGVGNNTLAFSIKATGQNDADTSFSTTVKFENATTTVSTLEPITVSQVYSAKSLTMTAESGQDFTAVKKITITLANAGGTSRVGSVSLTKLRAGSLLTASTNSSSALVASSKVYPNPVSDEANVELNLKSASSVKVTLSDVMGKEVMTIADGNFSSLNKSFSVAGLNKGIYTVNYFVDGAAAKAEMLMVK